MPRIEPELQRLKEVRTFPSLIKYLKEELNWPIPAGEADDVSFSYEPSELGFNTDATAKIEEVKQLRPLDSNQKWGIFWVKFGKKQLPVQILRRALGNLVVKKRASSKKADRAAWEMHDLLFISAYGDDTNRHITFAHFSESEDSEKSLPVLKVLGWDDDDTLLHLKDTYKTLVTSLNWENTPVDDPEAWREHWSAAFKVGHREVINTTKELVVKLAQLATVIKKSVLTSIKAETEKGPWKKLMLAFQKTLIKDLDEDQFADVIAQTVSYGLLTARLSSDGPISLKNLVDMVPSTNPFLKELLQHFLTSAGMKGLFDVDEAGINDVVELLNRSNAQAIRNDFGKKTDGEDPVIHFYEHFLGVYDKELKVERGVFYTPRDVVSYIVRSAHELLQKEFGLEDGLADTSTWADVKKLHKDLKIPEGINPDIEPFVQILDPATGTATFLIEVIDVIHGTMTAKWDRDRVSKAEQNKKWNTYVPTHLLPRLYAYELMMAPYAIAHMKVGLKLTETGFTAWDKLGPENRANIFLTNALEPWSSQLELPGFNALAHEAASVKAVKRNKRFTVIIGNPPYSALSANLTAENRRLVDRYRQINGVKIKERSMLQFEKNIQDDYIKFFVFSESTTEEACHGIVGFITNHSYIDGPTLRGMRASLVSTFTQIDIVDLHGNSNKKESQLRVDENVFEIQQGVAVALLRRGLKTEKSFCIGHLYGTRKEKYEFLRSHSIQTTTKSPFDPRPDFYHFIAFESNSRDEYERFLQLEKVFLKNSMGTKTGFNELLLDFTRNGLIEKISHFGDNENPEDELREEFNAKAGHAALVLEKRGELLNGNWHEYIKPFQVFPFDYRWAFLRKDFLQGHRFNVMQNLDVDHPGLVGMRQTKEAFGVFVAGSFCGHKLLGSYDSNNVFPVFDLSIPGMSFVDHRVLRANLNETMGAIPSDLELLNYTYATFHSPKFRKRYSEFLKIEFPRLALTGNKQLFLELAKLGNELTALHLLKSENLYKNSPEFIGRVGYEIEKISWSKNTVWIDKSQTIGFKGAKEEVWNFHIGGYQVCEKWLKDRKGRKITKDDIEHYQKIVVALSETIRLMAEIDKVIDEHGGWPGAFQSNGKP